MDDNLDGWDRETTKGQTQEQSQTRVRVLTLNVWGIKHISKCHTDRLRAIAEHIANPPTPTLPTTSHLEQPTITKTKAPRSPDIVALQELFTYSDYVLLRRLTRHILPHGAFYHNGSFGAGLVILSHWHIEERRMEGYVLNGRPSAFWRGDWYVGKGVACARVRLPKQSWDKVRKEGKEAAGVCGGGDGKGSGYLQIFNTHLHAPYNEGTERGSGKVKDTYACHRACQAWQIGGMMRRAMERGDVVVGCGDFNTVVSGLEYRVLLNRATTRDGYGGRLRDVWREVHPDSSVGAWVDNVDNQNSRPPTVRESLQIHGHTCDSIANTWRWSKSHQKDLRRSGKERTISPDDPDPRAKRLDYIFLGDNAPVGSAKGKWTVTEARICMTERHPSLRCSLSDHFGVEAEIVWSPSPFLKPGIATTRSSNTNHPEEHLQMSPSHKSAQSSQLHPNHDHDQDLNIYQTLLSLLSTYTIRTLHHRRRRLLHFLLSVLVSIGCHIAIWFTNTPQLRPPYVPFILMLLSTLGLVSGAVDGLIGGLFCGLELRRLKMVEEDVRSELGFLINKEQCIRKGAIERGDVEEVEEFEAESETEMTMGRVKDWWD